MMNPLLLKSNRQTLISVLIFLSLSGCMSDCKLLVKPAVRHMAPLPDPVSVVGNLTDPLAESQWTLERLGLPLVWSHDGFNGTRRVTVAILSTGVDYNHEDLRANILVNPAESALKNPGDPTPIDSKDDDGNGYVDDVVGFDVIEGNGLPYDRTGPGTAAAGIIGAVHNNGKGIKGVNVNIGMIPIRYINENGQTTIPNLVKALQYALAVKPDVVFVQMANMGFASGVGGLFRESVAKAEESAVVHVLEKLRATGIPLVVSAGNTGSDNGKSKSIIRKFVEFENVLVVTSVDQNDQRPFIANYGMETVATAAPGEGVLSTLPRNHYGIVNGTFAAAAHVAGSVALAVSRYYGRYDYHRYFQTLLNPKASDPLPQMELETIGGNRLNVAKFFAALDAGK